MGDINKRTAISPHFCTDPPQRAGVLSLNALHEKALPRVKQNFSINHRGEAETGFAGDGMSFKEDWQPGWQSGDP